MDENMKKDYTKCYIAFLDILGFKNRINHSSCQEILDIYKDIKNPLKSIHIGDENNSAQEIYATKHIHTKVMSDSICFYIDSKYQDALFCLLSCCAIFQAKLLRRPTPILVRGAVVLGDIYAEGDITFGSGMTQAYLLEEENAKYPRIIITKETLFNGLVNVSRPSIRDNNNQYVYFDADKYYVVNWLNFLFDIGADKNNESFEMCYQKLSTHIDSILSSEINASVREKYLYLDDTLNRYYHEKTGK